MISDIWNKISAWLEKHAPAIAKGLSSGASEAEIAQLEAHLGFAVPSELKKVLQIHNGESEDEVCLFGDWSFLSSSNIIAYRNREIQKPKSCEPVMGDPRIQNQVWLTGWIPIAHDGSGGYILIDTDPAKGGSVGQIIKTCHDNANIWVASNLSEFFSRFFLALESGVFESDGDELNNVSNNENWWIDSQ